MEKLESMLNKEVANLAVLYVKLHNYHWYVNGSGFLALHVKFEELYDSVTELYDLVAERMLALGLKPAANMKNYLAAASIGEAEGNLTGAQMCASIAKDFKILVDEFKEIILVADKSGDGSTSDMLTGAITDLQKQIWILNALAK